MQIPHLWDGSKAILHSHLFWWYNGTFQIRSATDVSLYSHPEILNWITGAWSTNHFVWGLFHVDANFRYTKSVVFDFTRPRVLGSAPSWLFKPSLWLTTLVWTLISVSILRAFHPMQTIKQFLYLAPRYVATTRWISGVMWQASFIVVVAPLPAARRDQSVKWACFTDIPTFPLVVHVVGWGFMPIVQGNVHNLVCRARWWNQFFCLVEVPCTLSWWRHYVHGTLPACDTPAHTSQRWVWPNQWTSFCVAYRRTDQILWLVNGSKELLVKQPCVHFYEKVKIQVDAKFRYPIAVGSWPKHCNSWEWRLRLAPS